MTRQSRIKFNPVTKELEIEGAEKFVKTYFDKIQKLISGVEGIVPEAPKKRKAKVAKEKPAEGKTAKKKAVKEARKPKKTAKAAGKAKKTEKPKRERKGNVVLGMIIESAEGIDTTALQEKTGLKDRQIWAIVQRAIKQGKIKAIKRGVYAAA